MKTSGGIHHITAITGNPQKNLDFYEGFLGQRLIKRTVNFDDPRSYHFYFGDAYGTPGTLLTFFYWKDIPVGTRGVGEVSALAYSINPNSKTFWQERARAHNVPCMEMTNEFSEGILSICDPDGMVIELVPMTNNPDLNFWEEGSVPKEHSLKGFYNATLTVQSVESFVPVLNSLGYKEINKSGSHARFLTKGTHANILDLVEASHLPFARQGSGSVHHIAFRAESDEVELIQREKIIETGLDPTPVIDRQYFHSVYFRTPSQILFEIATDGPGFLVDEPKESLGEKLVLPSIYELHRTEIVASLVPIKLPRYKHGDM